MKNIAITMCAVIATTCAITRGPYVPPNAKRCGADLDCADGQRCEFPGVGTYAVCVPTGDVVDTADYWNGH